MTPPRSLTQHKREVASRPNISHLPLFRSISLLNGVGGCHEPVRYSEVRVPAAPPLALESAALNEEWFDNQSEEDKLSMFMAFIQPVKKDALLDFLKTMPTWWQTWFNKLPTSTALGIGIWHSKNAV